MSEHEYMQYYRELGLTEKEIEFTEKIRYSTRGGDWYASGMVSTFSFAKTMEKLSKSNNELTKSYNNLAKLLTWFTGIIAFATVIQLFIY